MEQLQRRKEQRKADGALSPAWGWSGLLRKTRMCIRRLAGLCRKLVTYLPSKVIQGVGAKTGHKEAIRNITRAKLLGLCEENQNSPAAEACEGHQKLSFSSYTGRKSRPFALCSVEWVNASLSTLP